MRFFSLLNFFERRISSVEIWTYSLIVLLWLLLSAVLTSEWRQAERAERSIFAAEQKAAAQQVGTHAAERFNEIYQGLRTIARLPGVRRLVNQAYPGT